jgi:hypothetical protein
MEVLPFLCKEDAYKYMLENHGLIKTSEQALQAFKLLFDETGMDRNSDQRLTFAYNILPLIHTKKDLDAALTYLHPNHRDEFENSCWHTATSNHIRHT